MYSDRLQEIDWQSRIRLGLDWKDPHFPTSIDSLLDQSIRQEPRHDRWRSFTWKRPEEVYGKSNFILYDTPGPNDIKQGRLGNCYFLASLSAIAEKPGRIQKILLNDEVNEAGCYAIKMYINGEKRIVVVDDYFPYDTETSTWAFSQPSRSLERKNEIWALIIEKAWAKVFGTYQRIEAGTAGEALYPLTGCPMHNFEMSQLKDIDGFWKRLRFVDARNFPVTCCTFSGADKDVNRKELSEKGL